MAALEKFLNIFRLWTIGWLYCHLSIASADPNIDKRHILYLMRNHQLVDSLKLYQAFIQKTDKHDFEVLEQLGLMILEEGTKSSNVEEQLLSIYSCGIAGHRASLNLLEEGIKSSEAEVQLASLQFLSIHFDDRAEYLLNKAMNSPFLFVRIEAAHQLAERKSRSAIGQIEGLMNKVPESFHVFFPELFAMVGSNESISILKHLIDARSVHTRIEAIASAARHRRDDLLPIIRIHSSHSNIAEQEICAKALGDLNDSHSFARLQKLSSHHSQNVALAALFSLYRLGSHAAKERIIDLAKKKNLFAIHLLADIPDTQDLLNELAQDHDLQIQINSAYALLRKRDIRCLPMLDSILVRDVRGFGFEPQISIGRALMHWKLVPSAAQQGKMKHYDLEAASLHFREHVLRETLELPGNGFIAIASKIFDSRQTDLIPLLIRLLENKQTPEAISLLKKHTDIMGAPLIRSYCQLALFRLKEEGGYEKSLLQYLKQIQSQEIFRFRPSLSRENNPLSSSFELTPDERSRLLIESYEAISDRREIQSIDILLEALEKTTNNNRFILAGLLLKTLQ